MMKKISTLLLALLSIYTVTAQTNTVFYTSMGNFMVEIRDDVVPETGNNFLDLVNDKFYDGIIFHRVIDNFMIQGGDPTGTGTGGPGYTIDDEFDPEMSNVQMSISMANSGPNSAGSQFFINLKDNIYLDYDEAPLEYAHAVFGMVTEGFEIVQDIGTVTTGGSDRPVTDVVIDSIRVTDDFIAAGITDDELITEKLKVYPNPITANSIVALTATNSELSEFSLYDSFGKLISTTTVQIEQGLNEINLSILTADIHSNGIYFLRVTRESSTENIRIQID